MEEACTFCRIVRGELPAYVVYETDRVMAFLDRHPVSRGHTLVVPKEHVETIYDAAGMSYVWEAIVAVANAMRDALDPAGMNVDQNNGAVAGQEVFHLHSHLIPRYTGGETDRYQDPVYDRADLERPERLAGEIRDAIAR